MHPRDEKQNASGATQKSIEFSVKWRTVVLTFTGGIIKLGGLLYSEAFPPAPVVSWSQLSSGFVLAAFAIHASHAIAMQERDACSNQQGRAAAAEPDGCRCQKLGLMIVPQRYSGPGLDAMRQMLHASRTSMISLATGASSQLSCRCRHGNGVGSARLGSARWMIVIPSRIRSALVEPRLLRPPAWVSSLKSQVIHMDGVALVVTAGQDTACTDDPWATQDDPARDNQTSMAMWHGQHVRLHIE